MKTFAIATLGCKVNSVESDRYIQVMKQADMQQVDFKDVADTYIINTCAVTHAAAAKSRQKIAAAIKNNPQAKIVVVGCSLTADYENISRFEAIDTMIFQEDKERFDEIVLKRQLLKDLSHRSQSKTRAFMKIQDGCEQYCSFCIIPIARGNEVSVNHDELIETATQLVDANHQEIVLTGIHIGKYGIKDNTSLLALLKDLVAIEGLKRIRISSIEITELHQDLIEYVASQPKIANHLHIPLQSGSNRVLNDMNRPYTIEEFKLKLEMIKNLIPDVAISSDVIAGFVGESEVEFIETMTTIEEIGFSFVHVFPYSKRKNTKAAQMDSHLDPSVIKSRSRLLVNQSKRLKQLFYQSYLNKEVQVLFEHATKYGMFGHSEHYLPVIVESKEIKPNSFHLVKIIKIQDNVCIGTLTKGALCY